MYFENSVKDKDWSMFTHILTGWCKGSGNSKDHVGIFRKRSFYIDLCVWIAFI